MPAYVHQDLTPYRTIEVFFKTVQDRLAFAAAVEHPITDETKFIWLPRAKVDEVVGVRWKSVRPQNPRYPVYVPTKGRWDSALTIKALEYLKVPYYAVVQSQERLHYEPVVKTGEMLLLPEGLDGLVPTRNWIFEHAVASGAERHWQLDDNIKQFYRYHENRQIRVSDGTCMRIAEDFVDRYENVAIAGFQYFMFIPRKKGGFPPYVFNTRVYSNSLINNSIPFRYRDVYNDDTDICLRALKAGWCTVQFNAFNAYKMPTMTIKGGNTPIYLGMEAVAAAWAAHAASCASCTIDVSPTCEEGRAILEKDGRWRMAESLRRQHPDVTTVGRRFRRWQHYVDYRRFKGNVPILRPNVILPSGEDDYGLRLVEVEREKPTPSLRTAVARPRTAGPSIFAFLSQQPAREAEPAGIEKPSQAEETVSHGQPEPDGAAPGPDLFQPESQSIAQFLGTAPARPSASYVPDQPPDLTGISAVVLNFATDGIDWVAGHRPVGVTVATLDGQLTRFLPFKFAGGNLDEEAVKRWAREQLRGKLIVNSKTKFDVHMAREWGVDLEAQGCWFSDVQHTAALLDDRRKRFGLDVLAADYFPDEHFAPRVDETMHRDYHAADVAARELVTAQLVGRLRAAMLPELAKQELEEVQRLEDDVIPAVVEMEKNGSPIDMALLEQFSKEAATRHDDLLWEVADECGFAFDHTAKGWQLLFERLGLPPTEGNAEVIVKAIDHPTVKKAYLASQYASLNSKTFAAYKQAVKDGVLRVEINQLRGDDGGTVSGRFSIPYVQQVPNADNHSAVFGEALFPRRLFIPAEGEYLEADAMQIEQRLLVHYMDNAAIIKEYEGDRDRLLRGEETVSFHRVTWEMMKRYKADMLYSHQKSFNFAKQYGAKSIKLAVMMGFITEKDGAEIRKAKRWSDPRLDTIHEIEAAYRAMVPEGDALLDRAAHLAKPACDEFCKKGDALHRQFPHRGYVKTFVGRRSRFPDGYKTYIGLNRVLQGTGADIMKRKLIDLHRERAYTGLLLRMTVHDAVGGDAQRAETKARVSEVLNAQSYPLKVDILWSVKTGRNWAECK